MQISCLKALTALGILMAAAAAPAQTATYHLHNEASTINTSFKKLLTAGPDATATTAATISLKGKAVGEYVIKEFETQANVPNSPGVIPSGSTFSLAIWMRDTASVGTLFARAKIRLNNATGTLFCTTTASAALTTTVARQTFTCVTSADITMAAADRFYVWVGVNLTAGNSTTAFTGELDLEGTLNGNFDSQITVPVGTGVPTITALSPSAGAISSSVVITGTNFRSSQLNGSIVKFNGTSTTPSGWNSTNITAPVPPGVPTGNIAATVTVGGQISTAVNFAVTPAPSISSLAPNVGAIGSSVKISGANFNTQGAGSQVTFAGTAATITSWTTSSIAANVPAGANSGNVVVTDAGGVQTSGVPFTVTAAPIITGLSPSSSAVGSSVTIAGANFNAQGAGSTVTFGGVLASSITSWTSNSITANVPSGAVSGNVVVTDAGGVTSNGMNFTVVVPPTITSLTPSSGEPGASVSIVGNNFTATTGTVTFNGLPASATSWTNTNVTAIVPSGATSGSVVLTTGGLQSNGAAFTVLAPVISNTAPTSGVAGTIVAISGNNFGASAGTVTFGGQSATINSWAQGSIQAVVPSTASSGNVVVSHGGLQSNGVLFTVSEQTFAGPVNYSYDELGRLIGAVAATGDSVRYAYDPVGNITSITRYSSGQFAFFTFTPKSGPVGTNVAISGSNFSSNPAQDSVTFNGTAATIISATSTTLVVSVPLGATSGPLAISSPSGSITTADSFTVTNSDGKPRIDSFTPQIALPGTAVTITGANFDSTPVNDRLIVNVTSSLNPTSAASTSMSMNTPSTTGSGRISLNTPTGSVTSSADLFIPPSTYTVNAVAVTGRVTAGVPATITLSAPNQIGMFLIDGKKGQMVSAVASNSTFATCSFYIFNPSNAYVLDSRSSVGVASGSCGTSGQFFDSQMLPSSGTYTVLLSPGSSTGHATLTTYLFDDVQGGSLSLNSPATATTSVPGQNANFNIAGHPNQHVSFSISSSTFNNCFFTIANPDGTFLVNSSVARCDRNATFLDIPVLPQIGPYKLVIDPSGTETGSVTFKLNDATDVTGTITTDGTPVTVATTIPGQKAKLTFSGTAGQVISALLDNNTYTQFGITMTILAPDGSSVTGTSPTAGSQFIDATILPTTGTYTVVLAPGSSGTGQSRVRLFNIASDFSSSGTLGGAQVPITIGTPGQNAKINFTGTPGGRVAIAFTGAQFSGILTSGFSFKILQPDGTLFAGFNGGPFSFGISATSGFVEYNDAFTFPLSGTYTLILDPSGDATGSMMVTLDDATDISLNVNTDGSTNSFSTTNASQNAHLNFAPSIGQQISAVISNITYFHQPIVTLQRLSGGTVFNVQGAGSDGSNLFLDAITVTQTGSYFLFIDPQNQEIGSASVTFYTINDVNTTVDTLNDPVTVTTTVPGQNANLTFSATAGQSLTLSVSGSTFDRSRCNVHLQNPAGFAMAGGGDCTGFGPWSTTQTAPQTGTYTIVVDPVLSSTGSLTVSMRAQ